jgi:hypothetical protein
LLVEELAPGLDHAVMAQVEDESKVSNHFIVFKLQALIP